MTDNDAGRFQGVTVPDPRFAGDDGSPDPTLAAVLAEYAAGERSEREVAAALAGTRLMVPVVAVLDELEEGDGLAREKSSHMATVSLVSGDGRRGLLAFTSVATLAAWNPDARGIPATAQRVAASAIEDAADAVLLDLGGPVRFALHGAPLEAVASGRPLNRAYGDPDVHDAIADALADVVGLDGFVVDPGPAFRGQPGPDIELVLDADSESDVSLLADDVATRLSGHPLLVERCPNGIAVVLQTEFDDEDD